jgi:hypothetical protein
LKSIIRWSGDISHIRSQLLHFRGFHVLLITKFLWLLARANVTHHIIL